MIRWSSSDRARAFSLIACAAANRPLRGKMLYQPGRTDTRRAQEPDVREIKGFSAAIKITAALPVTLLRKATAQFLAGAATLARKI